MIMTLALLVYSIAQRRLRAYLKEHQRTLSNQIKQAISNPINSALDVPTFRRNSNCNNANRRDAT